MPFAQSTDADATSRVFIAQELLDNFRFIISGHWAPIHHYINALALFLFHDYVYSPKIMNIIFAVATCIPLYYFTRDEFNKKGAVFVTLIYTFSPVVFKNSFLAMAEIPYAFFILLCMYYLSKGTRTGYKMKYAIYAGISITIAGGIRYEAWELIAIFFLVLVFLKQWRMLIPFGIASVLFPIFWMVGNYIEKRDFLYSFHYATSWINNLSGINDHVTRSEYIQRILFFPLSWFLMITPFLSIILLITVFSQLIKKRVKKQLIIWLLPFLVMMVTYIYSAYNGTLFTQHRFTITLVILSVPYFALIFEDESYFKIKQIVISGLIFLMVPLSFYWHKIPFYKLSKVSYALSTSLSNNLKEEAIPRIKNDAVESISSSIKYQMTDKKGLILDFMSWANTYYIALNSTGTYKNIFIVDGTTHGSVNKDALNSFFNQFPSGIILLNAYSKLDAICHSNGALLTIENISKDLYLEKFLDLGNVKVFRYHVKQKDWVEKYKATHLTSCGITNTIKDITYYENAIKNDVNWLNDVAKKAKVNKVSLDEMINIDAQWMFDHEIIENKKDSL